MTIVFFSAGGLDRSIRCLRNIIHWNLISAFILRNATWFVVQLTMTPEVHESNVVSPTPPAGNIWTPRKLLSPGNEI